jgi:hypothetical protein
MRSKDKQQREVGQPNEVNDLMRTALDFETSEFASKYGNIGVTR